MQMALLGEGHPARADAERMVRSVYARTYGARIEAFPPLMVAALDAHGRALCAAGLRTANTGFFSECYLDAPVERCIGDAARGPVERGEVLEVTTLAGIAAGHALDLISFVVEHGRARGMRFGMCTATAPLRRALVRAGLSLHVLARARAERVADPAAWGSYYTTRPRVCVIADPLWSQVAVPLFPLNAFARGAAAVA